MPLTELPAGTLLSLQADGSYRYRVDELIGAGGFGITYLAQDARLGGCVVIKELACDAVSVRNTDGVTIRPAHGREESFNRLVRKFRDEVHLLHRINSQHVVRVIDFFDQNGTTYYAMTRVDSSGKLGEHCFDGPMESAKGQRLLVQFQQLLTALEMVHEAGIIHGDIKPDNVLIDSRQNVVLIDFGTARQTIDLDRTATSASHTPGFAAPELMHRTRVREVGPHSDLYSWAMMFYGAVVAHPPGDDGRPLDAYVRERNDPYGDVSRTLMRRGVPTRWAHVVARCLRLVPSERLATVAAARAILDGSAADPASDRAYVRHSPGLAGPQAVPRNVGVEVVVPQAVPPRVELVTPGPSAATRSQFSALADVAQRYPRVFGRLAPSAFAFRTGIGLGVLVLSSAVLSESGGVAPVVLIGWAAAQSSWNVRRVHDAGWSGWVAGGITATMVLLPLSLALALLPVSQRPNPWGRLDDPSRNR